MKKYSFTLLFMVFFSSFIHSQTWQLLPNSPSAGFRHDDLFFINADTGWVVNVDGYIYKTMDGGNSFITQWHDSAVSFRCVGFANANRGWAGNLGPGAWSPTFDTMPLYETFNGGTTWQPVTNISGPLPKGLCGISVVNESVIYAVGRIKGPSFIMKTTNGGASWVSVNFSGFFNTRLLIDCHFFSADTGIVVGSTGTTANDEHYAVYYTANGGNSWQKVAGMDSNAFNGHGWKISFPSRKTGYVSIESDHADSIPILKTTDGGLTWSEKMWSRPNLFNQGIGFINDSTGWSGSPAKKVKQTFNGGETWLPCDTFVANYNRFRKVNNQVAYASGNRIWKYTAPFPTGLKETPEGIEGLVLEQNFPNPFSSYTTIQYTIPRTGKVVLKIYDSAGRPVKTLVNGIQHQGQHKVECSIPFYEDNHFFYTLSFENVLLTKKMMMKR